ncbi:hypothetical protein ACE1ET_13475 [Saccharicrinis sp. FJH62]|uniref:hypothetical protein n=1 Tax=Saccharicrinis sp. FJH62 TaxID=3344657 RepID=UPI0035D3E92A
MKKFFLKIASVLMALVLFNAQTFAGALSFSSSDLSNEAQEVLNFSEDAIYAAFSEIEDVTSLISQSDVTYEELASQDVANLELVSSSSSLPLSADGEVGPPLGIPSFLWGCLLSWVGLLIVYFLTDRDKDETRKALWGCIISTLLYGGGVLFTY